MTEFQNGIFDANLGGCIYKKRIRFKGHGKRGSGRTILCYKKDDKVIFMVFRKMKNRKIQFI